MCSVLSACYCRVTSTFTTVHMGAGVRVVAMALDASFGSCLITAMAREIASGTRCISLVLSSRPARPVTHEIHSAHGVGALAASKQR